jgi:hypothetical protein
MGTAATIATPKPRYTKPEVAVVNPYCPSNTPVKVVKSRYIMPKIRLT